MPGNYYPEGFSIDPWDRFINDQYRRVLDRDVEAPELATWTARRGGNMDQEALMRMMLPALYDSPESRRRQAGVATATWTPVSGTQPGGGRGHGVPQAGVFPLGYRPGEQLPSEWNLTPQQSAYFQDQASNFTKERGRMPDEGEMQDLIADARIRGGPSAGTGAPWWGGQTEQHWREMVPWQVNPMVWDSLGSTGQQLSLGFLEKAGWDPNDWVRQLNQSRPIGQAPRSVQTQYAQPRGTYR